MSDPMTKDREEHNIAIVLSAGRGSRMHMETAKQYLDMCGRPVIAWSLRAFERFEGIDDVILVSAAEDIEYCRSEIVDRYGFRKGRSIVSGGAERFLSVWEGLKEALRLQSAGSGTAAGDRMMPPCGTEAGDRMMLSCGPEAGDRMMLPCGPKERACGDSGSYVFIHDGARPLVDRGILLRTLEDVRRYGACTAAMPVKDMIKISDENGFAVSRPQQ